MRISGSSPLGRRSNRTPRHLPNPRTAGRGVTQSHGRVTYHYAGGRTTSHRVSYAYGGTARKGRHVAAHPAAARNAREVARAQAITSLQLYFRSHGLKADTKTLSALASTNLTARNLAAAKTPSRVLKQLLFVARKLGPKYGSTEALGRAIFKEAPKYGLTLNLATNASGRPRDPSQIAGAKMHFAKLGKGASAGPSGGSAYNHLKQLWVQAGGPKNVAGTAAAVALAESSGNRNAVGDHGKSHGLWQVYTVAHPQYSAGKLHDPKYNARAAVQIYKSSGSFRPWTTYNTGAYRRYAGGSGSPSSIGSGSSGAAYGSSSGSVGRAVSAGSRSASKVPSVSKQVAQIMGTTSPQIRQQLLSNFTLSLNRTRSPKLGSKYDPLKELQAGQGSTKRLIDLALQLKGL